MPKVVRLGLSALAFAAFAVGALVISRVLIPRHRRRVRGMDPALAEADRKRFMLRCYRWMVGFTRRCGLTTYTPPPLPEDLPDGPYVLIANHPSLIDVLVLKATIPGITCVVRADLWRRWWLAPLLSYANDIPGPDGKRTELGETRVLDAFVARLREGHPVLVFPEGTRSPVEGVRRFRRGALEAAVVAGVPVVPAVIRVDPPVLKHGEPWWQVPDRAIAVTVGFEPVIPTTTETDSAALAKQLRRDYEARLR